MKIVLNYRRKNERIEEALIALGHSVTYNLWEIKDILNWGADAVLFEFKQILKEELKYLNLALRLKKHGIPRVTWCLDIPNIGASRWKLKAVIKAGLVDIFATHSLQGLTGSRVRILYLPNAAWTSRYNLGGVTLKDLADDRRYEVDVAFTGNIDAVKHPEFRERAEFLSALGRMLGEKGVTYRFSDSRAMDFASQISLIQKSRININYGCAADLAGEKSWGLPERCYGVPACGGFLLSEERVHGKDDFKEGTEIVMFKGLDDCLEKIRYYLSSPDERRAIAERAHSRVLAEHTYPRRMERLAGAIQELKARGR